MKILAIDTSCDDTCISIVNVKCQMSNVKSFKAEVLSNVVSSQVKIHRKYGGVYPSLAKREHQKNLPMVLKKALRGAKLPRKKPKIDAIAVTIGPGLDPCLWMGINFAKDLAQQRNLPIIPINHIEAHIFANFVGKSKISNLKSQIFPAICLIVSGGHTQLILMRGIGDYKIIGETRDDAAGECFDKTARILGLGYPGGPAIAQQAAQLKLKMKNEKLKINLPRPMINSKNYDFSFSGLKTAVLYDFKKRSKKMRTSKEYIREMAKEIQQAIIDVSIRKTIQATKSYKAKTIMLGGGVAANDELRKQFQLKIKNLKLKINFLVPPKIFCTDNAAMVGVTGYFNQKKASKNWQKIKANANLRI
ncbi:tRNA (adenosine(37)-N6)-threonylcarbamoyltransferase complex transferase subunit TsaD [Patescibacteria group bacterium]|nr:tRNA (adenosine(37)-N6)-threonylcarbamoyltransferase complex transferase subunit TsaD [Patescibacteria group bacterium]